MWPKGLLQLLELWSSRSCREAQAVRPAWQPEATASWTIHICAALGSCVIPHSTCCLMCSSWQTIVVEGRREVEGKCLCGGCRIRKEQYNSKPCKTRCRELCCCYLTLHFVFLYFSKVSWTPLFPLSSSVASSTFVLL